MEFRRHPANAAKPSVGARCPHAGVSLRCLFRIFPLSANGFSLASNRFAHPCLCVFPFPRKSTSEFRAPHFSTKKFRESNPIAPLFAMRTAKNKANQTQ
jgi:hypothetical protein